MSKFLRHSFSQIFGNPSTRILVLVFLLIFGITISMAIISYNKHVDSAIQTEFALLRATTRSLAMNLDGNAHVSLMKRYQKKDDITALDEDEEYRKLWEELDRTQRTMGIKGDIYTIVRDPSSQTFEFSVTSAVNPYFRHVWTHPHVEHIQNFDQGAEIGPYEDENGVWLSAFSPIKVRGNTVAIVQADILFSEFIIATRAQFVTTLLAFVFIFLASIIVLMRVIDRILSKEDEHNKRILDQSRQLEIKNKDIMSSIRVAKRLQEACLPKLSAVRSDIPELSVVYEPKDLVSGDFYWHQRVGTKVFLAAGDCTGHGIPGAFMSMMALTALYHVLNKQSDCLGELLSDLDQVIRDHLHSTKESTEGMDMSICSYDLDSGVLKYAGALRPLVLIREGELTKVKGDRSGIGGHSVGFQFQEQIVDVKPGDVVYLFSDGFSDQFGGEAGRKYMSKRFDQFLLSIQDHPLEEQKLLIQYEFHLWKEEEDQVDDVLVLGFKIPGYRQEFKLSA